MLKLLNVNSNSCSLLLTLHIIFNFNNVNKYILAVKELVLLLHDLLISYLLFLCCIVLRFFPLFFLSLLIICLVELEIWLSCILFFVNLYLLCTTLRFLSSISSHVQYFSLLFFLRILFYSGMLSV